MQEGINNSAENGDPYGVDSAKPSEFCHVTSLKEFFGGPISPADIPSTLMSNHFTLQGVVQPPHSLVPYHTHPVTELIIPLNGRVRLVVEEDPVEVEPGEVVVIPPEVIHSAVAMGDNPVNILLAFSNKN